MVVYRFHSDKATYDSSTRRYTFALDRRVPNATSVAIRKAGYRAARHSGTAAWPGSVLLRSDALHRALRSKHTVEAGSGSHEDASDALCVLEGTGGHLGDFRLHVPGRPQALVRQPNLRSIDFYFTDNGTTLRGDELLSGTDPAPVNALVAQGRVSLWVDTLAAGSYGPRKADGTAATASDAVASLVPRHPLSAVLSPEPTATSVTLATWMANGNLALEGATGASLGTSTDAPTLGDESTFYFLYKEGPAANNTDKKMIVTCHCGNVTVDNRTIGVALNSGSPTPKYGLLPLNAANELQHGREYAIRVTLNRGVSARASLHDIALGTTVHGATVATPNVVAPGNPQPGILPQGQLTLFGGDPAAVSAADMLAHATANDLISWLDPDDPGKLRKSDNTQAGAGDQVQYIEARVPSDSSLILQPTTSVPNIEGVLMQGKLAITQQAGGAWEAAVDSTGPTVHFSYGHAVTLSFKAPASSVSMETMWSYRQATLQLLADGSIVVLGATAASNVTVVPAGTIAWGGTYVVQVQSIMGSTPQYVKFTSRTQHVVTNASTNTTTAEVLRASIQRPTNGYHAISSAQTGLYGSYGQVMITTQDAQVLSDAFDYQVQRLAGNGTNSFSGARLGACLVCTSSHFGLANNQEDEDPVFEYLKGIGGDAGPQGDPTAGFQDADFYIEAEIATK